MSQENERVSNFQFTRSWRSREDFPTYADSEDQVRDDLQSLFDELRDFLNRRLLPAVNAISAAEITAAGGGSVQTALDSLRADLTGAVLGQVPDGSLTGAKLAPGALLEDVTAQMTVTAAELGGCPAYPDLRFYHSSALGLLLVKGAVTFTREANKGFVARYSITGAYRALPFNSGTPFACASGGVGSPRCEFSGLGSAAQLDIAVDGVPADADTVTTELSGWYFCGEVTP